MKKQFFLAFAGYFIGWLYWKTMLDQWPVLIFTAAFFAWGAAMGYGRQNRGPMHGFWASVAALIALAMTLKRCNATVGWSLLALHAAAVLWVLSYFGADRGGEDVLNFAWDCLEGFLLLPFGNFFGRIKDTVAAAAALWKPLRGENSKKRRQSFWLALLCLAGAFPLLSLVSDLLGQADAGFETLMEGVRGLFQWKLSENVWEELFLFALGLPVGAYLYGLLRGAAGKQEIRTVSPASAEGFRVLPPLGANLVWGLFAALYCLFFGVQAGNLFAVFSGHVPGTLTAADYARSGFFQLCGVMAINFGLVWLLGLLTKPTRAGKWLQGLLMVQSILLAVTAGAKLWLYISRFGFTPLRLLSAWAVLVLAVGCLLVLRALVWGKKGFRPWLYFAAASFTALCFY